jgi:hypothetical protein
MSITQLSTIETKTLADLEQTIARGMRAFMEVGAALRSIRDNRLYREKAKTFEEYCQTYWSFSRRYANQTIRSYQTVLELENWEPVGSQNHQWNSRQARQLSVIPEAKRQKVLTVLIQTDTPITAEAIRQAWLKLSGKKKEQAEKQRRQEWLKDFDKSFEKYAEAEEAPTRSIYAQDMEELPQECIAVDFDYNTVADQPTAAAAAWNKSNSVYSQGYDDPEALETLEGMSEAEVMELMKSKLGMIFNYLTNTRYRDNQAKILQSYLMRTFAMLYVMRLDLLDAQYPGNTLEKIAKSLGITAQRFEWYVRSFCDLTGMQNPHQKSAATRARMSQAHKKESFNSQG